MTLVANGWPRSFGQWLADTIAQSYPARAAAGWAADAAAEEL